MPLRFHNVCAAWILSFNFGHLFWMWLANWACHRSQVANRNLNSQTAPGMKTSVDTIHFSFSPACHSDGCGYRRWCLSPPPPKSKIASGNAMWPTRTAWFGWTFLHSSTFGQKNFFLAKNVLILAPLTKKAQQPQSWLKLRPNIQPSLCFHLFVSEKKKLTQRRCSLHVWSQNIFLSICGSGIGFGPWICWFYWLFSDPTLSRNFYWVNLLELTAETRNFACPTVLRVCIQIPNGVRSKPETAGGVPSLPEMVPQGMSHAAPSRKNCHQYRSLITPWHCPVGCSFFLSLYQENFLDFHTKRTLWGSLSLILGRYFRHGWDSLSHV